jgi:hypothetical protein
MNTEKLAEIMKKKRDEMREKNRPRVPQRRNFHNIWRRYLKEKSIKVYTITSFTEMVNKDKLLGKIVVQTDFSLNKPSKNQKDMDLNDLRASDVFFYVLDRELARKILVLDGMPP